MTDEHLRADDDDDDEAICDFSKVESGQLGDIEYRVTFTAINVSEDVEDDMPDSFVYPLCWAVRVLARILTLAGSDVRLIHAQWMMSSTSACRLASLTFRGSAGTALDGTTPKGYGLFWAVEEMAAEFYRHYSLDEVSAYEEENAAGEAKHCSAGIFRPVVRGVVEHLAAVLGLPNDVEELRKELFSYYDL